ncbi:TorD/DmsD family molecular chaperone [Paenibacillus antarcticus]|nr:molecular chaperone TorD family protein [Paenibacillus antarcticus]
MMTMTLVMVRDSEECVRWKQGRGWVYQLLIDFLRNRPRLSLIAQWQKHMAMREEVFLTKEGQKLKDYLSNTMPEQLTKLCEVERAEYHRLFEGVRPIFPSLCENDYRSMLSKNSVDYMLDIRNRYAQSGIVFNKLVLEQDDHISIELEYMAVLGERMSDDVCLRASQHALMDSQIQFLEQHVMQWVPSVAEALCKEARSPIYRSLGYILQEFLPYDIAMLRSCRAELDSCLISS